jgi:pimeloyl-ACP methyl ester carboxylesterase
MPATIILVHGAFAESASWNGVIDPLLDAGHPVVAAANPLRSVAADAAAVSDVVRAVDGPVVLVGHSYGGMVISNVAPDAGDIVGLVYVAGFAPDEGETIADLQGRFPSLAMGNFLQPTPLPDGAVELTVDPRRFRDIFSADVPDADAAFMARAQRPLLASAFEEPATAAAWRMKPSWAVFGTADQPIAPQLHRFSYDRAGSTVTAVQGASHFVQLSRPDVVADVIHDAVQASTSTMTA